MASSSKKKKIIQMQMQDALGISRKKWKLTISPKLFVILKLILITLIPIFYFIYSPILIVIMILYVGLFFLAIMAEHKMNKSVVKKNHIHFAKFDSAIALVIIVISIISSLSAVFKKTEKSQFGNFDNSEITEMIKDKGFKETKKFTKNNQNKTYFINFCTLSTGERNIFSSQSDFKIGTMEPPSDFPTDKGDFDKEDFNFEDLDIDKSDLKNMDFDNLEMPDFNRGNKMFNKDAIKVLDNIPIDYVSSSLVSTINTVLIFSVSFFGLISLLAVYIKKKKINRAMNEIILEDKIAILSNAELTRILSFGEDVEYKVTNSEIEKKIKKEHNITLKLEKNKNSQDLSTLNNIESDEEIEILKDDFKLD